MKNTWAVTGLALSMGMASLDTSIANAGLPAMASAFGASFPAAQWIVLAYLLAITTVIVGAGRMGDLLGRRRTLVGGIGLFTLASALCGLAPSLGFLIAARALQGVGAAVMMALTVSFATGGNAGRTMGLLGTMSALGTTLGPALGGLLIPWLGWQSIFLVNLPLGVLNIVLAVAGLPEEEPEQEQQRGGKFDVPGMVVLAVTLGAYALAMTGAGRLEWLLVAATGLWLFVRLERSAATPLIEWSAVRDPLLLAGNAMVSAVMMSTLVVGPFYLSRGLGLPAASVGLALSAGPLVAALTGVPAGRLVEKWGTRPVTTAGLTGMLFGCLALSAGSGVAGYLLPLAGLTASYALFHVANNTAVMADVRASHRGVVSGLLSLSRNLGLITGASVMGTVFALAGDVVRAEPAEITMGMRAVFGVGAGLLAVALGLSRGRLFSRIPGFAPGR